ncbi:hypothetical protein CASFOL_035210 [Castilleja foliolosa]|uniref:BZIP domain-containing protein n=1 Tax=Castilleja foliolosa TaxID=1961234 RepID=A0ABD3BSU8_9LAMI
MDSQFRMHHPFTQHNSWLSLTLNEIENHLSNSLTKPFGTMSLDELLNKVWTTEANQSDNITPSPAASLQRQASWSLALALSGKTVNEVWRDIKRGHQTRNAEDKSSRERELTLGELTLEDFLVKAGMYVTNASIEPVMSLDSALKSQKYSSQMGFSPSCSIDELSDTPIPGRKRTSGDFDNSIERRLRRKIKNRESAARSRARKQAYHNELETKISCLEEEILKLKKEKEFEQMVCCEFNEQRYQLRRTSSF